MLSPLPIIGFLLLLSSSEAGLSQFCNGITSTVGIFPLVHFFIISTLVVNPNLFHKSLASVFYGIWLLCFSAITALLFPSPLSRFLSLSLSSLLATSSSSHFSPTGISFSSCSPYNSSFLHDD
jgi:hypothetical protein